MSRAEGGALPEGVERALDEFWDAVADDAAARTDKSVSDDEWRLRARKVDPSAATLRAAILAAIAPPVAPSCSASFDAALSAMEVESDYAPDRGVTHTFAGLDDVRAAHAEAVRVAVEAEREACARACDEQAAGYDKHPGTDNGACERTAGDCAAAIRARKEAKS